MSTSCIGRKRILAGSLFFIGIILFCGPCYCIVIADTKKPFASIAPFGGISFMLGWLAFGLL